MDIKKLFEPFIYIGFPFAAVIAIVVRKLGGSFPDALGVKLCIFFGLLTVVVGLSVLVWIA